MRGRQMRGTSKTCVEKSSTQSVDVHVADDNIVFCCNICICCLKLHQADNHVEESLFITFFFWVVVVVVVVVVVEGGGGLKTSI